MLAYRTLYFLLYIIVPHPDTLPDVLLDLVVVGIRWGQHFNENNELIVLTLYGPP